MRRHARPSHLARRKIDSLLIPLGHPKVPPKYWSPRLHAAYQILSDALGVSDERARTILVEAVTAAHACANAINRRAVDIVQFEVREKLCKTFSRIANCSKRTPVKLRRQLDAVVIPFVQQEHIDLETIEAILVAATDVFRNSSDQEPAKTALELMTDTKAETLNATIVTDFSALNARDHSKAERAIKALGKALKKKPITASDVFTGLARALQSKQSIKLNSQIHTLIVDYVTTVADIWRDAGLRPSRARHPDDPTYKSRFHQYVELLLTEFVEPWARRHDGNLDDVRRQTRLAYQRLAPEHRSFASPAMRPSDVELLVSADHITKALRH